MIDVSEKYKPLFDVPFAYDKIKEENPSKYWKSLAKIETIVMTGGRGSGKSMIEAIDATQRSVLHNHRTIYTRYTDTSLDDSVKPDFTKAIEMLGYEEYAEMIQGRVVFPHNESKIVFKGLKPSSKKQTAGLKSLSDFSCFVVEEAEEHPSFEEWEKVALSLRYPSVQNYSILMLNPTTKEHWIYKEFFEDRGVCEGFNGIKDEVLYIHTTYLDVKKKFHTTANWNKYERGRIAYEEYRALSDEAKDIASKQLIKLWKWYKFTVLGGWLDKAEGVVYSDWIDGSFDTSLPYVYGLDFGFSPDPTAMVKVSVDNKRDLIYVQEEVYKTELSTNDIEKVLKNRREQTGDLIVADCAEKRLISDLKGKGINIKRCKKGAGSIKKGIKDIQSYQIIVCGESVNLRKELNNYVWNDKKAGIPIDTFNHLLDALRYGFEKFNTKARMF